MKKKITAVFLTVMLLTSFMLQTVCSALTISYNGIMVDYKGSIFNLVINGKQVKPPMPPIIFNDRAVVPAREVFESLGAKVDWEASTQRVSVSLNTHKVEMTINDPIATVDNKKLQLEAAPMIIATEIDGVITGKTMVPIRFVGENLGMDVDFDESTGSIMIAYNGEKPTPTPTVKPTPTPTAKPTATPTGKPTATPTGKPTATPTVTPSIVWKTTSYSLKNDTLTVKLTFDKKVKYTYFTMVEPDRIIIDFEDVVISATAEGYTINKDGFNAIRLGQHENSARLVIDTDEECDFEISHSSSGKVVTIEVYANESDSSAKPTASPSASPKPTPVTSDVYKGKIVVVDAGHGGNQPGALGSADGKTYEEKDFNLDMALKLEEILTEHGVEVVMTRTTDVRVELVDRPKVANELDAALFVSIHCNSLNDTSVGGTMTYYNPNQNASVKGYGVTSYDFAKNVQTCLMKYLDTVDRGVRQDTEGFAVLKRSAMPAVLVETAFISNPGDLKVLADDEGRMKFAQGIADGILKTLENLKMPE